MSIIQSMKQNNTDGILNQNQNVTSKLDEFFLNRPFANETEVKAFALENQIDEKIAFSHMHHIHEKRKKDMSISEDTLSKIDDEKSLQLLLNQMKKETQLEKQLSISNLLLRIQSKFLLEKFLIFNGNSILGNWIEDAKEEIENYDKVDLKIYDLLTNLLNFCDKLPINESELKSSKIGKKINKLGKSVSDRLIKIKCEEIVSKWKKLIDGKSNDYPDKDPDFNRKTKREENVNIDRNYKKSKIEEEVNENRIDSQEDRLKPQNNMINFNKNFMFYNANVNLMKRNYPYQDENKTAPNNLKIIPKSILKKVEKKSEKKGKIKWEVESSIEKIKIFISNDEPSAEVTEEDYRKIQQEILSNPNFKLSTDMRSKEISMEKINMSKARDKIKYAKEILAKMAPMIKIQTPFEIKINKSEENEEEFIVRGSESEQKEMIDILCQKILSVTYFRESEIPEVPKFGLSKLFCFTDENIPKVENSRKLYNPDKPNPNLKIIEQIENDSTTPSSDFIKLLISKLQDKEFTNEESAKIMDYLNKHSNRENKLDSTPQINNQANLGISKLPNNFTPMPYNMMLMNKGINGHHVNGMNMMQNQQNPINNNMMPINSYGSQLNPINHMNQMNMMMQNNYVKKPLPAKYKTRPCNNFHGPNGCLRGESCHFIHDVNFPGREIPNFNPNNYSNISEKKIIPNINANEANIEKKLENPTSENKNEDETNKLRQMQGNVPQNFVNKNINYMPQNYARPNYPMNLMNVSQMSSMSNIQNMPNIQSIQNMTQIPNMASMPNMQNMMPINMRHPYMNNLNYQMMNTNSYMGNFNNPQMSPNNINNYQMPRKENEQQPPQ